MKKEPELVDLGLPSGNLWMKCNLDATCETDYGNYYQWGSLVGFRGEETKKHSFWETCPFNDGKNEFDEEYFLRNRYKLIYKNRILRSDFDIVTQTYGNGYKMPEPKDFQELLDNTISRVSTKKNGRLFMSKINGNSIFIPFSGYVWGGSFYGIGDWCGLWLGRLVDINTSYQNYAHGLYCDSGDSGNTKLCYFLRFYGLTIRGIKVKNE